jgi:hypothetical protein
MGKPNGTIVVRARVKIDMSFIDCIKLLLISPTIRKAVKCKSIEDQIHETYGSYGGIIDGN